MSVVAGAQRATPRWRVARAPRAASGESLARAAVLSYVLLWLVEGALRKWVPATGTVMYVARDVVLVGFVLVQYATAEKRRGALPSLLFWGVTLVLLVLATLQVVLLGDPITLVVLGVRNYLSPLAFAYFFWRFWRSQGALLIRVLLAAMPVEFAVTALQVVSPDSAFINQSTTGDATSLGNGGAVRGSGTFSDAGVLATFVTTLFAICLGLLADDRLRIRRVVLYGALAASFLTMAIAGERTAVFGSAAVLVVWLARALVRAELKSLAVAGAVLVAGGVVFVAALLLYPTALASFGERFVTANQQENSAGRVLDSAIGFLSWPLTPLGDGFGMHSNAAAALGANLVWVEVELTRWVAEAGIVGLVLVVSRIVVGLLLGARVLFGLGRLPALTVTMSCVVAPELVAGSIAVNPAMEGAAAVGFAVLLWSLTARPADPRPAVQERTVAIRANAARRLGVGR